MAFKKTYHRHKEGIHRFLRFGIIGAIGTAINTAALYALTSMAGLHVLLASALATETAIIANFFGNHFFTFKEKAKDSLGRKFLIFQAISLITIAGTAGILWGLTTTLGEEYLLLLNLVAIGVMFVANYALNNAITWGKRSISILGMALVLQNGKEGRR